MQQVRQEGRQGCQISHSQDKDAVLSCHVGGGEPVSSTAQKSGSLAKRREGSVIQEREGVKGLSLSVTVRSGPPRSWRRARGSGNFHKSTFFLPCPGTIISRAGR